MFINIFVLYAMRLATPSSPPSLSLPFLFSCCSCGYNCCGCPLLVWFGVCLACLPFYCLFVDSLSHDFSVTILLFNSFLYLHSMPFSPAFNIQMVWCGAPCFPTCLSVMHSFHYEYKSVIIHPKSNKRCKTSQGKQNEILNKNIYVLSTV